MISLTILAAEHMSDSLKIARKHVSVKLRNSLIVEEVLLSLEVGPAGLAYLVTRYLITMTPLQNSFLARNRGLTYAIVIGYSLYRGILSTGKKCMVGLATLEDSRYGEFARRALQMKQDKKNLTRAEFDTEISSRRAEILAYVDPCTALTTRRLHVIHSSPSLRLVKN